MKKITNYGKSARAKLLNVSKQEGLYFQTLLTRYFQERLLYRLSLTQYKNHFFLKGGALMFAYERFAARPTLDMDFLGQGVSNETENVVQIFREICSVPCDEDGVSFDCEHITGKNITEFKDYHGVRLNIPVRMDTIAQIMTMDVGFGDVVTPEPVKLDYPLLLNSLPQAEILAYSVETVIAEKMHAVISLGDQSSRMKDYYDLYHMLHSTPYDIAILHEAVTNTFKNRHTRYDDDTTFFNPDYQDNIVMQTRWKAYVRKIAAKDVPPFHDVVEYLQNELRPYWEALKDER